ncbi:DinB family protein [Paenibacillus montanisoli]|uniref:Damage-inducible protein DinB n=1 Tax=Paenibacillus montanisoli TaxID=2081970 RepID=A0A328U798_9BACL|nr:DinB family protein [Paenibacillus montanisoli]RAP77271.1 hypothetical protein DL346_01875 [Paenibacillus montanisoli]
MFTNVQSFINEYRLESASTQKQFDSFTDASLKQKIAPDHRTLGYLAWHIVATAGKLAPTGLIIHAVDPYEQPVSARAIAESYRKTANDVLVAVKQQLTDDMLHKTIQFYENQWTIGYVLYGFLKHEIHHRGQLTVLMRQAGLPVAGMYGPSKEEWLGMGMQPQK